MSGRRRPNITPIASRGNKEINYDTRCDGSLAQNTGVRRVALPPAKGNQVEKDSTSELNGAAAKEAPQDKIIDTGQTCVRRSYQ